MKTVWVLLIIASNYHLPPLYFYTEEQCRQVRGDIIKGMEEDSGLRLKKWFLADFRCVPVPEELNLPGPSREERE